MRSIHVAMVLRVEKIWYISDENLERIVAKKVHCRTEYVNKYVLTHMYATLLTAMNYKHRLLKVILSKRIGYTYSDWSHWKFGLAAKNWKLLELFRNRGL